MAKKTVAVGTAVIFGAVLTTRTLSEPNPRGQGAAEADQSTEIANSIEEAKTSLEQRIDSGESFECEVGTNLFWRDGEKGDEWVTVNPAVASDHYFRLEEDDGVIRAYPLSEESIEKVQRKGGSGVLECLAVLDGNVVVSEGEGMAHTAIANTVPHEELPMFEDETNKRF